MIQIIYLMLIVMTIMTTMMMIQMIKMIMVMIKIHQEFQLVIIRLVKKENMMNHLVIMIMNITIKLIKGLKNIDKNKFKIDFNLNFFTF